MTIFTGPTEPEARVHGVYGSDGTTEVVGHIHGRRESRNLKRIL